MIRRRLHRSVFRRSVYNHAIWPMILSSRCYALKLFSNSLDHQDKLAFILSFSLISVLRPFFPLSALRDLLFSSPGPFDLRLLALGFTSQNECHKERQRRLQMLLCCLFFPHCVIMCVIIPSFNLLRLCCCFYHISTLNLAEKSHRHTEM